MDYRNQEEIAGNVGSDKSKQPEFTFLGLKEEFINQYGLPKQPCPVRSTVLENFLSSGTLALSTLADECIIYCQQHTDGKKDVTELLVRLCYAAGIISGQDGNPIKAQFYFAQAYQVEPSDIQVASNYALALSKNNKFDDALEIYEQILLLLEDGQVGFSPQVWTEAVNIHCMKGNFRRALELVEISIQESPEYFGDDARAFAEELRSKIANA